MKKKILYMLAMLLVLPFAFFLSACGGGDPADPGGNPPGGGSGDGDRLNLSIEINDDIWFTKADAGSFTEQYVPEDGNELAVWISDYFDKDTLVVKLDGEPVTLVEEQLVDYENRIIGSNPRKIATFSVSEDLTGTHTITYLVEEVELTVKFVSNGQTFSADERAVLGAYRFADGTDFETALDNQSFKLTTTYSELVGMGGNDESIPYTSDKPYGYYSSPAVIKTIDQDTHFGCTYTGGTNYNNYSFQITSNGDGFSSREIELTFNKDFLNESALSIGGENRNAKIFSYTIGDVHLDLETIAWKPSESENKNVKVYLEPYANVDLSSVRVFIFDEEMQVFTDPENSKKYFTIPAGKLPVEYISDTSKYNVHENRSYYYVVLKNIDFSASNLFSQFDINSNNNNVENQNFSTKYCYSDGKYYYEPGVTQVVSYVINDGATPLKIKVNSTEFSLSGYNTFNSSLPLAQAGNNVADEEDAYRTSDGAHFYKIQIGSYSVFLVVDFNNEKTAVKQIDIHIALTGNTTISLIF